MERGIIVYDTQRMLDAWRLRQGVEPLSESVAERHDGYGLDRLMLAQADAWYAEAMAEMPTEALPVTDISDLLTMTLLADGTGVAALPEGCVRVVSVMMTGWEREAVIAMPGSEAAADQLSPYTRGRTARPVAVVTHGTLRLYTPPAPGSALRVKAVVMPAEGTYHLTERMLAAMPTAIGPLDYKNGSK